MRLSDVEDLAGMCCTAGEKRFRFNPQLVFCPARLREKVSINDEKKEPSENEKG
jgi:hypothetical protein